MEKWKVHEYVVHGLHGNVHLDVGPNGLAYATANGGIGDDAAAIASERAAFIVDRVNAHEPMVDALMTALARIESQPWAVTKSETTQAIRAALALARNGNPS